MMKPREHSEQHENDPEIARAAATPPSPPDIQADDTRPQQNITVSSRSGCGGPKARNKLLAELEVGQIRRGVVKNIAPFGAFVDLGGIDGLLLIPEMSWGRVRDPHDVVKLNHEIEVYILHIDREKERIALSLRHKTPSPWQNIEQKYPVATRRQGKVVNIMPYGVFIELELGIEGLVHLVDMSWTKRMADPKELVQIGDKVEVQVLKIDPDKKEIWLSMKQCQPNPWVEVAKKYPPGTDITGIVRTLTNYGAFIEIAEGVRGLVHVTDLRWAPKVTHPSEVVQQGQKITCRVLSIDVDRSRIALGLKQMTEEETADIPIIWPHPDSQNLH